MHCLKTNFRLDNWDAMKTNNNPRNASECVHELLHSSCTKAERNASEQRGSAGVSEGHDQTDSVWSLGYLRVPIRFFTVQRVIRKERGKKGILISAAECYVDIMMASVMAITLCNITFHHCAQYEMSETLTKRYHLLSEWNVLQLNIIK